MNGLRICSFNTFLLIGTYFGLLTPQKGLPNLQIQQPASSHDALAADDINTFGKPVPLESNNDVVLSLAKFERDCINGHLDACLEASALYEKGPFEIKDAQKSRRWAELAYEMGSAEGCYVYGNILAKGIGGKIELGDSILAHLNGCQLGVSSSCYLSGLAPLGPEAGFEYIPQHRVMHYKLRSFERGCEYGSKASCEMASAWKAYSDVDPEFTSIDLALEKISGTEDSLH